MGWFGAGDRDHPSSPAMSLFNALLMTSYSTLITSPPHSHLGRARRYPHLGECTLPLRLLAVTCTMLNEALRKRYRTLRERYGTLRNVRYAPYAPSVVGHYGK